MLTGANQVRSNYSIAAVWSVSLLVACILTAVACLDQDTMEAVSPAVIVLCTSLVQHIAHLSLEGGIREKI